MIYDKTRILLNPFVGLLLGCKSSYIGQKVLIDGVLCLTGVTNVTGFCGSSLAAVCSACGRDKGDT